MSAEGWGKLVEFVERKAWVLTVVLAFLLFMPHQPAQQIGIRTICEQWQCYAWIAFVLASLLTLAGIFSYFDRRVVGWFASRVEAEKKEKANAELKATLKLRLSSLNEDERGLVLLCLSRGSQSFSAKLGHTAAESLNNKGLVRRGSGTVFDVAYHFTDDTWRYLMDHREDFYPEGSDKDPAVINMINYTENNLHERF